MEDMEELIAEGLANVRSKLSWTAVKSIPLMSMLDLSRRENPDSPKRDYIFGAMSPMALFQL